MNNKKLVYIFEKMNQFQENVIVAFLKTFFENSDASFTIDRNSSIRDVINVRISNLEFNRINHLDSKIFINNAFENYLLIPSKLKLVLVY
ncbi:hypothetical protein J0904_02055 [Acinetobacter bereziniae]|uniref:hypothetical protein n=1 Tax=Acinetobacter bereziniae TaxID=106648 RepID=UPI0020752525|nr:hypothetical protein [Acinetobacter bereziniae]MCM8510872.1 hypothetical protein [Acinetobacter bereziniae]